MLAAPDRRFDPGTRGELLIAFTVVVAYVAGFIVLGTSLGLPLSLLLILLGILHIWLAARPLKYFFHPLTPFRAGVYFALQTLICGVVQYFGRGYFWLMLMPLASTGAVILSRKAVVVLYAFLLLAFLSPLRMNEPATLLQNGLIFGCALVFVWIFTEVSARDQQIRRRVEKLAGELEEANRRLRESAAQAEELARSRERNRLAREIHDSLGHYLTVVNVQLEAARALLETRGWESAPELSAALEKAQTLTRSGLADVRRSVAALRTDPLGDKPFLDALQALLSESRESGLVVGWRLEGEPRPASPQTEMALYRALQEALTNVRKHARASRVDVLLRFEGPTVRLEVADNGVGFAPPADGGQTFGLRGMRERADLLGGRMGIGPAADGGTLLTVELPLGNPPPPAGEPTDRDTASGPAAAPDGSRP
jgi:signal transduction histidine kinase